MASDLLGRLVKRIDLYQGAVSNGIGVVSQSTSQCTGDTSNPETATWSYDPTNATGQVYQVNGKEGYQRLKGSKPFITFKNGIHRQILLFF